MKLWFKRNPKPPKDVFIIEWYYPMARKWWAWQKHKKFYKAVLSLYGNISNDPFNVPEKWRIRRNNEAEPVYELTIKSNKSRFKYKPPYYKAIA